MTVRCPGCRTRVTKAEGDGNGRHTAACPFNVKARPDRVGEYVAVAGSIWGLANEAPILFLDPVPDHNDLMTEQQAHVLRNTVTNLNMTSDDEDRYCRVIYVPDL